MCYPLPVTAIITRVITQLFVFDKPVQLSAPVIRYVCECCVCLHQLQLRPEKMSLQQSLWCLKVLHYVLLFPKVPCLDTYLLQILVWGRLATENCHHLENFRRPVDCSIFLLHAVFTTLT